MPKLNFAFATGNFLSVADTFSSVSTGLFKRWVKRPFAPPLNIYQFIKIYGFCSRGVLFLRKIIRLCRCLVCSQGIQFHQYFTIFSYRTENLQFCTITGSSIKILQKNWFYTIKPNLYYVPLTIIQGITHTFYLKT